MCCALISCLSCQAIMRLIATASTSSRIPSCSRKESKLLPVLRFALRIVDILFMLGFSGASDRQIRVWRLLALLDETMQQHHALVGVHIEQHSRDPTRQIGPNLMQSVTKRATGRHTDRPTIFDGLDVLSHRLPLVCGKVLPQPVTNRLVSPLRSEEECRDPLRGIRGCGLFSRFGCPAGHRRDP